MQNTSENAPPELRLRSKSFHAGSVPERVLGSDKNDVSSEEGQRDSRGHRGVAIQASLPRGVFAYQRLLVMNSLPLAHLVRPGKPLPLLEGEKGRKHRMQL